MLRVIWKLYRYILKYFSISKEYEMSQQLRGAVDVGSAGDHLPGPTFIKPDQLDP